MPSDAAAGRGHRLHPATLLFTVGGSIRNLLLPAVAVLLFSQGRNADIWLAVLFVPAVVYHVFQYLTLQYTLGEGELVVREGFFFRNERHVPYQRIQNIDLEQGPLHRLLGVAEVRLQTGSGGEPEASLKVVSVQVVERLRERIFGGTAARRDPVAEKAEPPPLVRLSTGDLVKLGVISFRGVVMVGVLLAVLWELDVGDRLDTDWLLDRARAAWQQFPAAALVPALVAVALVVLLVLSAAWTVMRFHGYRLDRVGDEFRITCGLWTRVTATVPRRRVQFVSVHESLLHRLFGCVSVKVETAGGEAEREDVSRSWFVPVLRKKDLAGLLAEVRPGLDLTAAAWQPLAPGALRRKLGRTLILPLLLSAAAAWFLGPWGWAAAAAVVAHAVVTTIMWIRFTAYAVLPEGLAYRSGSLVRKTSATFFDKVQVVSLTESPFDRRHGMATLAVDTAAAGPAGHVIHVPYLPAAAARGLLAEVAAQAESSGFQW